MLVDVPRLITAYYSLAPGAPVSFGTSGHRGSAFDGSFNEGHILAITQAICEYRAANGADGPLFLAKDTHALSEPAFASALEVLGANGVEVMVDDALGYTPTPTLSHAVLMYNRGRTAGLADGIVITPSHNPPDDGGFKYNPPNGGPADTSATRWIQDRANQIIAGGLREVRRMPYPQAVAATTTHRHDYVSGYVNDLGAVLDMDAIRDARLNLCADPLGGAGVAYWGRIAERYGLQLTIQNDHPDPTFRFMSVDWDGKIRMDCSSPYAMAGLIALKDKYDLAFACDTDHDRHGIVTRSAGLMNPESLSGCGHLLSVRQPSRLAAGSRCGQNAGIEQYDRSSRRATGTAAGRGPGRLQVVRGRTAGRCARFRRRRECRRQFPPSRRHGVDDRQGRHHHGAAGRGDAGAHRPGPGRNLSRTDRTIRRAGLPAHRFSGLRKAEGAARQSSRRTRSALRNLPGIPSNPCSPRRRATARRLAG